MRIALTGATGWIGQGVVPELRRQGHHPVVLTGDVRNPETFADRFDILIHLASARREDFIQDGDQAFEVNLLGTRNALQACLRNAAPMVFISTSGVYARDASGVLSEETGRIAPPHPYGVSKWQSEEMCRSLFEKHGMPVRILRLFNVYGPNQPKQFLIGFLVRQAMHKAPLELATPNARRDFIHVDDVRHAIVLAASRPFTGLETCNVGSGRAHSVLEVGQEIQKALNYPLEIVCPAHPETRMDQAIADISRIRRLLDWNPAITLTQGIRSCLASAGVT